MADLDPAGRGVVAADDAVSARSSSTFCSARKTSGALSSGFARTSASGTRTTSVRLSASDLRSTQPIVPAGVAHLAPAFDRHDHLERRVAAEDEKRLRLRRRRVVEHGRRIGDRAIVRRGRDARQRERAECGSGAARRGAPSRAQFAAVAGAGCCTCASCCW